MKRQEMPQERKFEKITVFQFFWKEKEIKKVKFVSTKKLLKNPVHCREKVQLK